MGKKAKKEKAKKAKKLMPRFLGHSEAPETAEPSQRPTVIATQDLPVMVRESPQNIYDAYILNLSGTLLKGGTLLPGVDKVFESLNVMRRPAYFMSSNSHTTPADYQRALANFGMQVDLERIFTPARVAGEFLHSEFPDARVFVIGDEKFSRYLSDGGVRLTVDPDLTDLVLVAHDRDFNFAKLETAYRAITGPRKAMLVTTSMVRAWPRADGMMEPGTRGIVRSIESATGRRAIRNLGTPERGVMEYIFGHIDAPAHRVLLVSDSLTGDISSAKKYGVPTALVLTGEASLTQAQEMLPKDQPNFVLDSVASVIPPYIMAQL